RSFSSAAGTAPPAEETSDEAIGDASRRGRLPVLPGVFLSVIAEPGGVRRHRAGGPPRAVEPLQEIAPAVHPAIERLGRSSRKVAGRAVFRVLGGVNAATHRNALRRSGR